MIKAILTDIEGTTSSISFVKDVLFPYAANALPDFLQAHWNDETVQAQVKAAAQESGTSLGSAQQASDLFLKWIAEDRKATPLKALQGMIWAKGYRQGEYTAHLYPDTANCLRQWHDQGLALYVYSSGSIAAQKLFFGFSDAGDLTGLFSGYFDTTSGHKQDSHSYLNIQQAIGLPAQQLLFLSDVEAELDAAATAGLHTIRLDREGSQGPSKHTVVTDFNEITLPG
ncbi:enolase [Alcanivorax hongdengensis A-11-3]|uniref:Enolase-phosphatase E1 n=1 Tax=Alcanivorax hongdengensis A-11-3 TaxID=1177179 RepID=L0W820_9GAMM|nr:acireductone synthase [Alcanivorax hongdengensis]EKF73051.1 enolase [Alcanivorax hongdengensis A-11-3]